MNESDKGFLWRSPSAFVIVAAGATLGLNDFLTFPVLAVHNGGGAFLMLYILFLFVLGLPLLMTELMLGRLKRGDPSACLNQLSEEYRASVYWRLVGVGSVLAAFLIISAFSVVAGWSLAYTVRAVAGVFDGVSLEEARQLFESLTFDGERMALWHTLFVMALVAISAQPLRKGLEGMLLLMVPMMFFLLATGLVLAVFSDGMSSSVRSILEADFAAIDHQTPLLALQRAFYTLALGLGVMMVFGRYLPANVPIGHTAALIVVVDLLFSIFTGLSINALMFSAGHDPGTDNQFAFRIIPVILGQFSSGGLFTFCFFLLMTVASLTTTIALIEAPLTYLQRKFSLTRIRASIFIGIGVWLCGLGVVLAHSIWNGDGFSLALFFGGRTVRLVSNAGFHDVLVFTSSHLIQPLMALLLCLFAAWKIPRQVSYQSLALKRHFSFEIWCYLMRYIVPVLILIVILAAFGFI